MNLKVHLFYSELAPTDPRCNVLQTLPDGKNMRMEKYVEEMSD